MIKPAVLTDLEVVERVLGGDTDAFGLLVERYQRGLANYIFHMVRHYEEALELTQEVFLKIYSGLDKYDRQYKFSTWIYKIASNHTIDHMRRHEVPTTPLEVISHDGGESRELPVESPTLDPCESLTMKDMLGQIQQAVDDLPPSYRELVVLRHYNFRSYEEMAKITGLPLGTVKNRVFRARQLLIERLKDLR
jgi:RNA polymerase sigma-70 factor (ECF subfamily)